MILLTKLIQTNADEVADRKNSNLVGFIFKSNLYSSKVLQVVHVH